MTLNTVAFAVIPLFRLPAETFYRSVSAATLMAFKSARFLSGEHAGRTGGRYNSPGQASTLYLGGSQTLASLESEQSALFSGVQYAFPTPRIMGAVRVSGAEVLDLTNVVVCNALGISPPTLMQSSPVRTALNALSAVALTQMLGDAARQRPNCDGILAPSWLSSSLAPSFPRTVNLILFMDSAVPDQPRRSSVQIDLSDTPSVPGLIADLDVTGT